MTTKSREESLKILLVLQTGLFLWWGKNFKSNYYHYQLVCRKHFWNNITNKVPFFFLIMLLLYQMKIKFLRVQYLKKTKIWDCNERQVSHYLQHSRKIGEIFLHVCMSQTTYPLLFSNYFLLLSGSFHRLLRVCVCGGGSFVSVCPYQ